MNRRIRRLGDLRRDDRSRGQALVEFGLVLPIFILVLIGIMDLGVLFFDRMTVVNSTREGIRIGITYANQDADPDDPDTIELTNEDIRDLVVAQVLGASGGLLTTDNTTVDVDCLSVSGASMDCELAGRQDRMRVHTEYTYRPLFPLYFGSGVTLDSEVTMAME